MQFSSIRCSLFLENEHNGIMVANFELDLKKVVAYSTLRQLGFIIRILSIGSTELVFLHLFIHAIFKSLIFICVGRYIHYMYNNQDIRMYYGILKIPSVPKFFFLSKNRNLQFFLI